VCSVFEAAQVRIVTKHFFCRYQAKSLAPCANQRHENLWYGADVADDTYGVRKMNQKKKTEKHQSHRRTLCRCQALVQKIWARRGEGGKL
jgi:hypothetical protein